MLSNNPNQFISVNVVRGGEVKWGVMRWGEMRLVELRWWDEGEVEWGEATEVWLGEVE